MASIIVVRIFLSSIGTEKKLVALLPALPSGTACCGDLRSLLKANKCLCIVALNTRLIGKKHNVVLWRSKRDCSHGSPLKAKSLLLYCGA